MSSRNMLFTVDLPGDWADRTIFTFMGPEDGGVQHLLTVTVDPEAGDVGLYDYATERIELVMASAPGAEKLKEEERQLANGAAVYECVYKWFPTDGKAVFQKLIYMITGGVAYTFTASFSKRSLKTIAKQVEGIINSLTPVGPETEDD